MKKIRCFCNAIIIKENEKNNIKYILTKDHSVDCIDLKVLKNVNESINDYGFFIQNCFKILENSKIYDRKKFRLKL